MPIEYTIDAARGYIHVRGWGVITDQDIRNLVARIKHDRAVRPDMKRLCDWRAATRFEVTTKALRAMVETEQRLPQFAYHQIAVVAPRDVVYGMARMYQILSEEHQPHIAVFRDSDEALAWLGLAPNEV